MHSLVWENYMPSLFATNNSFIVYLVTASLIVLIGVFECMYHPLLLIPVVNRCRPFSPRLSAFFCFRFWFWNNPIDSLHWCITYTSGWMIILLHVLHEIKIHPCTSLKNGVILYSYMMHKWAPHAWLMVIWHQEPIWHVLCSRDSPSLLQFDILSCVECHMCVSSSTFHHY